MAAPASTRTTWKGAISFGLVHIPIVLYSGVQDTRPKFKWIDRESMSAVGNQQVSKTTGEAVAQQDIVKGIEVEEGQYVTLTRDEIRAALPKTTQTIEIEAFVDAGAIQPGYFNKPYYVAPATRGTKAYALLRDTMKKTGKVGIARVVISTKQHLAALIPTEKGLVLNLLRWADEVRDAPADAMPDVAVSDKEMKMAELLVNDLAAEWSPGLYHDEFKEQLQRLVQAKAARGDIALVQAAEGEEAPRPSADVIDLTELLRRSLQGKTAPASKAKAPAKATGKRNAANDEAPARARAAAAGKAPVKAKSSSKPVARRRA
ncbi:MAG: Ku protein [Burkholderiales bacterium]|nr:Ku protein [Burkholderiales bacterium]